MVLVPSPRVSSARWASSLPVPCSTSGVQYLACFLQGLVTDLSCSAYYIIGIPFGIWLAFNQHWNLLGLWIGLTIALIYESLISSWICLTTDWDRQVEKVQLRLAAEHKAGLKQDAEAAAALVAAAGGH